jgi:hypothetical protein
MTFHKWVGTDSEEHSQCLTCGGLWEQGEETHLSARGEWASNCSGNTSQCHHYGGECPEDQCQLDSECNCLFCQ